MRAIQILLVPLLAAESYSNNYQTSQSLRYVDFSGAAYCTDPIFGDDEINSWSCNVCHKYPNVVASTFHGDRSDTNGYAAYDKDANEIIVAFSGTDPLSIRNWIDDIDFFKTPYPYCAGCEVHEGFYKSFQSVVNQVNNITKTYLTQYPTASLTVTGHSLGMKEYIQIYEMQ